MAISYKFESSLESLARLTTKRFGIQVTFEGEVAYTDNSIINLPYIHNLDEKIAKKMHGYLNHEIGHIKFTDFYSWNLHIKTTSLQTITNIIEDIRIESLMMKNHPGTSYNIIPLRSEINEKYLLQIAAPKLSVYRKTMMAIQLYIQKIDFEFKDLAMTDYFKPISLILNNFPNLISTLEVIEMSKSILLYMEKELEDQKEKKEEKKKSNNSENKDKESTEPKKNTNSENDNKLSKEENVNQSESECNDHSGQDKEKNPDGSSKDELKDGSSNSTQKDDLEQKMDDQLLKDNQLDELGKNLKDESKKPIKKSKSEYDLTNQMNEILKDIIQNDIKQIKSQKDKVTKYGKFTLNKNLVAIPVTTKYDKVVDLTKSSKIAEYTKSKNSVLKIIMPIKMKLEQLLTVKNFSKYKQETEEGFINDNSLNKMIIDRNYNTPFKKLYKLDTNDIVIQILIDQSGSMANSKIEVAKSTAIVMSESLNDLNIPCEVTGFHSETNNEIEKIYEKLSNERKQIVTRHKEFIVFNVFKNFEEKRSTGIENLYAKGSTPDSESIKIAATRLASRPEKRKILFVLSDGEPAVSCNNFNIPHNDLKLKISQIEMEGIEVVAFGIQTDSVSDYYTNCVIVNQLSDLPVACMNQLSKILLKNRI